MNPSQNTTSQQKSTLKILLDSPISGDLFDIQIKAKSSFFASHKHQSHDIISHDNRPYVKSYRKAPHFDINGHRLVPVLVARKDGKKATAISYKRHWKGLQGAVAYTRECNSDNVNTIVRKLAKSGAAAVFVNCYSGRRARIPVFTMSQKELEEIENLDRIGAAVFLHRSFERGKVLLSRERPALSIEGTSKLVQAIPRRSMFGRVCGVQNLKEEIKGATVTCFETDLKPIQVIARKLAELGASNIMVTRDPGIKLNSHMFVEDIRTVEWNNQHTEVNIKNYRKE